MNWKGSIYFPSIYLELMTETMTSLILPNISTEIQTWHRSNKSLELYRCINLLGRYISVHLEEKRFDFCRSADIDRVVKS
jgi:hypothetical protein